MLGGREIEGMCSCFNTSTSWRHSGSPVGLNAFRGTLRGPPPVGGALGTDSLGMAPAPYSVLQGGVNHSSSI